MSLTSMALAGTGSISSLCQWQDDVGRHAHCKPAVAVVDAQPDLERFDVAFGTADVALRREARVRGAVEHLPLTLGTRGQPYRQRVADAHAIDVRLLDVDADPEVVRIDDRDHRLTRRHDLARQRRADVDDAVER